MRLSVLLSFVLIACGGEPAPAPPVAPPTEVPVASPTPSPPPPAPVVNLLDAVATDVATSSAYRDQAGQIAALVDGDLETAWNGRTDDLVGAWIEVRVPDGATVTSIELTAGFTHTDRAGTDLFTGNHRVARVRVLRDGVEVISAPVDPERRDLQPVAIEGPGGVYRIEIAEVIPGTNAAWREVCVSELRVMGRSADARSGERYPRLGVGALPAPRPLPLAAAELAPRFATEGAALVEAWARLEGWYGDVDASPAAELIATELRDLAQRRRAAFERLIALTELADDVAADAVRRRAAVDVRSAIEREPYAALPGHGESARADLDVLAAALATVRDAIGTDAGRCTWAQLEITIRLDRIALSLHGLWSTIDTLHSSDFEEERALAAPYAAVGEADPAFERLRASWHRDPRGTIERLGAADVPDAVAHLRADEEAMRAALADYARCPE